MSHSKKFLRRQPSKEFGCYLRKLRERNTKLKPAEAARELGVSRQQLYYYEKGRTSPPDPLLIKLAQLYHVPPDEVLRKAHWPQLILLPLIAIIDLDRLSRELIEALEEGLEESERQELTEHIETLLRKRSALKRR